MTLMSFRTIASVLCSVQCLKRSRNHEIFICAPQFMFSSEGYLRNIFLIFWLKYILKVLWTCLQSFGKIYWLFFDLWARFHVNTTRAKVSISNPNANPNPNLCSSYTSLILCSILEVLEELFLFISIYLFIYFWLMCTKRLVNMCESFEKIFWPVSDLLAKGYINGPGVIWLKNVYSKVRKSQLVI